MALLNQAPVDPLAVHSSSPHRTLTPQTSKTAAQSCNGIDNFMIWRASAPSELPQAAVLPILCPRLQAREVTAALTGPDKGFQVARDWQKNTAAEVGDVTCADSAPRSNAKVLICGTRVVIDNWKEVLNSHAFGKATSLYDTNPVTGRTSGDPIADAFVLKMRRHSAFLAVADGVNWGEAPMRAARCAVNAIYEHLESNLFLGGPESLKVRTTKDAANLLYSAFNRAHLDIIAETEGLSTLCVGLLLPVYRSWRMSSSERSSLSSASGDTRSGTEPQTRADSFAFIVASVGDSQAFLLRENLGVTEVTGWVPSTTSGMNLDTGERAKVCSSSCDDECPPRDFRDAGGALGAVHEGKEPELHNLMCAVAICGTRDVVILGTDGLTDNFDPVVARLAVPQAPEIAFVDDGAENETVNYDSSGLDLSSDISDAHRHWKPSLPLVTSQTQPSPDIRTATDRGSIFRDLQRPVRHRWTSMSPLPTPYDLPIWPKPPPPPPLENTPTSDARIKAPLLTETDEQVDVSARSLNFTDQLELSWPERRQYATKEIMRIWNELDTRMNGASPPSAVDFGEALLRHVRRITAQKRQLLEAPDTTKLKAQYSRYMRRRSTQKAASASGEKKKEPRPVRPEEDREFRELEAQRARIMDAIRRLPGKLDHATVLTLEVNALVSTPGT
ncbi:unnamed protein product [Schistocephalus solidus]|uniref:PPM-type phosphatase domain-containing protein n=3 Tax=Schistocephalus solidus TaxID=70667 RepID=A0A183STJ4_SCHSO|nr:unnamed protein product [Schistocephalus solidus]